MTDTKTPPRRTARPKTAKTGSSSGAAPAVKAVAKAPATAAATKPAARKTAATATAGKTVAKVAPKTAPKSTARAPTKRPAVPVASKAASRPVAAKPAAAVSPTIAATAPVARVSAPKPSPQPKGDSFKLRMLVDQVVKATGAKKKGVKDLVAATLSRIGDALARGDELNLPGIGKVRIVKTDDRDGTAVMTLKLRQSSGKGTGKQGQKGLADDGDDD